MDTEDQPEEEGGPWELVMPFVVVTSHGGPYDDEAFAAGWQAGEIDRALTAGADIGATTMHFPTVRTALIPQLELIGMRRGFPIMETRTSGPNPEGVGEWAWVAFSRPAPESDDQ